MGKALKRTGRIVGVLLFLGGLVRSFGFLVLDVFEKFKSAKELLEYLEKFPQFTKSVWFGPVMCIGGVVILTIPLWLDTVRQALGEKTEKQETPGFPAAEPRPTGPDLQVDVEEAQVFIKLDYLNKDGTRWLIDPELLVKVYLLNKSPVPTNLREIRATFITKAKTFEVWPSNTVHPISSEVRVGYGYETQVKSLKDLQSGIAGQVLNQGDGKSGWLRFSLKSIEAWPSDLEKGELKLKFVDAFSNEHITAVQVPHNKSTDLVIMTKGEVHHAEKFVEPPVIWGKETGNK